MRTKAKWLGTRPEKCDNCGHLFEAGENFSDAKTCWGPWAILCQTCHEVIGRGIGTGYGQVYDWTTREKVAG